MLDAFHPGAGMPNPTLKIQLPKSWPAKVCAAMLHVVSLAKYAAVYTRSWAADSRSARVRLRADKEQLVQEVMLLREELRIRDARMASLPPHRRPFYPPSERLAILEVRAARGWSLEQTAAAFLVCPKTIASWMKRLDEKGSDALVQLRTPVNKFPAFVRYAVQRLQALCPTLGKQQLAKVLARAGLHLATTTIGRIRKEKPLPTPPQLKAPAATARRVTAKRPNHLWHVDLTTVPTQWGFWCNGPATFPARKSTCNTWRLRWLCLTLSNLEPACQIPL
jgi:transposase-like protein